MSKDSYQKIRQEIRIWIQCFFVSIVAVFLAYDSMITQTEGVSNGDMQINLFGLLRNMWSLFLLPWLIFFFALSLVRFIIAYAVTRLMGEKKSI